MILVGDIHIDNNKSLFSNSDSFNQVFNVVKLIKDTARQYRPDFIIFFGDIFNVPNVISSNVLSVFSKILNDLVTTFNVQIYIIAGNHDISDNKIQQLNIGDDVIKMRSSLLFPFKYFENVTVIDMPTVATLDDAKNSVEIGFIPFSENIKTDLKSIANKFSIGSKRILMGHFEIKSPMTAYTKNNLNLELPTPDELVRDFGYEMVLLGHIHDIAEIKFNRKLLKYIGSCRNINYNNFNETKGIYTFDSETFELNFIENVYTNIYKTFNNIQSVLDYIDNNTKEKLSRVKLRYLYSNNEEIAQMNKVKLHFKSVQFQKNIVDSTKEKTHKDISHFEDLVRSNLVTKDTLLDFVLNFLPPKNKDVVMSIFDILESELGD